MIMNVQSKHRRPVIKDGVAVLLCVGFLMATFSPKLCLAQAGSLDPTFGDGGRVTTDFQGPNNEDDRYENAVAIQADGKIVVVGTTLNAGGYDFAVARYNLDGSPDTGFGTSGKVAADFDFSPSFATDVAIQTDGKIVVAGYAYGGSSYDFAVLRLNPDGSLDPGFGSNGKAITGVGPANDEAYGVAIQSDGKIVVAGRTFVTGPYYVFALVRFNSNGSLDTGFGGDGKVTDDFNSPFDDDSAYDVAIQVDGKILLAGSTRVGIYPYAYFAFALARYNGDGSLDTGFDSDGHVITDIGPYYDYARSVALQADGKIIAAGSAGNNYPSYEDFALARYNSDGSLDTGFDSDGLVVTDFGHALDFATSVALKADGKIIVAGTTGYIMSTELACYNSNGSLDTGFGRGGQLSIGIGRACDVAVQNDSKIVVSGITYGSNLNGNDFSLARYNSDGSLDTGFDKDGWVKINFIGPNNDEVWDVIASQSDGKIIAVGMTFSAVEADFAIARYNPDGSLDPSFGENGKVETDFGGSEKAVSVAIQADGKIVVAGFANLSRGTIFALARYNNNGSLDTNFGTNGKVTTDFGFVSLDWRVALQADGKILVLGSVMSSGGTGMDYVLARYNSDGSLDTTFDLDGWVTTDFGSQIDRASGIALQTDGKIIVAGSTFNSNTSSGNFALARYNNDGSLDLNFDGDGRVITDLGANTSASATDVAIQVDSKIVVAGNIWTSSLGSDFLVVRYNSNGSLDTGFDSDGWVATDFGSREDVANGVVLQADSRIVVAGYISNALTGYDFALARFNSNGSPDVDFDNDGKVSTDFGTYNDYAYAVAIQAGGKIVVAGTASLKSSGPDFALACYLSGTITTPQEQIQLIITQVQNLVSSAVVNDGQGNALLAKLQAALQQLDLGNTNPAINQLQAFINQVQALMVSGEVSPEEGEPLIAAAQQAIALTQQGLGKQAAGDASTEGIPTEYMVFQNYPNPFNPTTEIRFQLPAVSHVVVKIYNALGAEIRTLADAQFTAGYHRVRWDGKNEAGNAVASGIYFYKLEAGSFSQVRPMTLVR